MKVESNIKKVVAQIKKNLNPDKALRIASFSMLAVSHDRIFTNGLNAKGTSFGNYNKEYQRQRLKKYNRANTKINLIATGELERGWIVGVVGTGFGLGFQQTKNNSSKNPNAPQKAAYMDDLFKDVFMLSKGEIRRFNKVFNYEYGKK
jgi:hypothetical protein